MFYVRYIFAVIYVSTHNTNYFLCEILESDLRNHLTTEMNVICVTLKIITYKAILKGCPEKHTSYEVYQDGTGAKDSWSHLQLIKKSGARQ